MKETENGFKSKILRKHNNKESNLPIENSTNNPSKIPK
jgi:hypothetical protein